MRFQTIRLFSSAILCFVLAVSSSAGFGQAAEKPASTADEAAPHYPTSEELRHIKAIGQPLLSPDGKQVLFSLTDSTADGAKTHLWLVSAGGGEKARQLTFSPPADKRGERGAQWVPDGSAIYFIAKRDEHTQLLRLDLRGGEAAPYDLKVAPVVDESKEKNANSAAGRRQEAGRQDL